MSFRNIFRATTSKWECQKAKLSRSVFFSCVISFLFAERTKQRNECIVSCIVWPPYENEHKTIFHNKCHCWRTLTKYTISRTPLIGSMTVSVSLCVCCCAREFHEFCVYGSIDQPTIHSVDVDVDVYHHNVYECASSRMCTLDCVCQCSLPLNYLQLCHCWIVIVQITFNIFISLVAWL